MWRSVLGLGVKSGLRTGLKTGLRTGFVAPASGSRAAARNVFAFSNRRLASTQSKTGPREQMTLKKLVKEYGWTATGVYCLLMCIDLPLCYLLVHSAGQDNMEKLESRVRELIGADSDPNSTYIHKAAAGGKSLFLAEFAIAYIIHKMLIVVRVPLTIAMTPAIAAKLQQWGFNVNRVMPSVDKSKLAARAADVNSPTVRRAAEAIAKRDHKPVDDVAKDLASKAGKAAESGKNTIVNAAESGKTTASTAAESGKNVISNAAESGKSAASNAAEKGKNTVSSAAESGKNTVSNAADKRDPSSFGAPADKKKRWWWFF